MQEFRARLLAYQVEERHINLCEIDHLREGTTTDEMDLGVTMNEA